MNGSNGVTVTHQAVGLITREREAQAPGRWINGILRAFRCELTGIDAVKKVDGEATFSGDEPVQCIERGQEITARLYTILVCMCDEEAGRLDSSGNESN